MDKILTAGMARGIIDMCAVEKRLAALEAAVEKFTSTNNARDEICPDDLENLTRYHLQLNSRTGNVDLIAAKDGFLVKFSDVKEQLHNTGSPKLPTWEEVYKWGMESHGTPDLDQGRYAILRGCYDYICRTGVKLQSYWRRSVEKWQFDAIIEKLEEIRCGIIDVETAVQNTNTCSARAFTSTNRASTPLLCFTCKRVLDDGTLHVHRSDGNFCSDCA
jgi:hypothetical protein